jgi:hypothetical protein
VLCSREFRNSVPNSIRSRERGEDAGVSPGVARGMLTAVLVRRIGGSVPVGECGSRGGLRSPVYVALAELGPVRSFPDGPVRVFPGRQIFQGEGIA